MIKILKLFQIRTVRSAWVFLVGSGLIFAFNVYLAVIYHVVALSNLKDKFGMTLFLVSFVVLGVYMSIAGWALFSAKGRGYLVSQERIPIQGNRTLLWYAKFLFACYAVAFATMMLLGILFLPFAGTAGLDAMFSLNGSLYLMIAGLVWSPLIFRYLK